MIVLPPLHGILRQGNAIIQPPTGWTMAKPYITGVCTSGEVLTAHMPDQDPMPELIGWQWYYDSYDPDNPLTNMIIGATQSTYLLSDTDVTHTLVVVDTGFYLNEYKKGVSNATEEIRFAAPPAALPVNVVNYGPAGRCQHSSITGTREAQKRLTRSVVLTLKSSLLLLIRSIWRCILP
jgi:hypothetical protein